MSTPGDNPTASTILTPEQTELCLKIAALDAEVNSQRAKALLCINDGLTQAAAAEASDLTAGQVRYLMTQFRKSAMALFPDEVIQVAQNAPVTEDNEPPAKKETPAPAAKKATKEKAAAPAKKKVVEDTGNDSKKKKKKRSEKAKKNKVLKAIRKQSKKKTKKKGRKKKK